jgi:hypothetical protein
MKVKPEQNTAAEPAADITQTQAAITSDARPPTYPAPASRFDGAMLQRRHLDAADLDYCTSLPDISREDKAALANVLNVGGLQLQAQLNRTLAIVHVTVAPVDYTDDSTGEIKAGVRVIVTTKDGGHYSCGGIAPVRAIRRICGIFGPPPFSPPVMVIIKPIPLADGKSTYTLEVV